MRKPIKISKPRSGLVIFLTEEAGSYLGGYGTPVDTIYVASTGEFVISADDRATSHVSLNKQDRAHPMRLTFSDNHEVPQAIPYLFGTEHVQWQTDGKATIRFLLPSKEKLNPPIAIYRGKHKPKVKPLGVATEFTKMVESAVAPLPLPSDRTRLIDAAVCFNDLKSRFPGIRWTLTEEGLEGQENVLKK